MNGDLAKPGNFSRTVNLLVAQLRLVGLADLGQLWLSLPEQDKTEFEGHFSRMVLRLFHGLSIDGGRP